jgi:hypothetical protein
MKTRNDSWVAAVIGTDDPAPETPMIIARTSSRIFMAIVGTIVTG